VAGKFHVSEAALRDANQLQDGADLKLVEALAIPQAAVAAPMVKGSGNFTQSCKVRRGDTLVTIADRYGVSLAQLRRWNKLPATTSKVEAGRKLFVSEPASMASTVKRGAQSKSSAAEENDAKHDSSATKSTNGAKSRVKSGRNASAAKPAAEEKKPEAHARKSESHAKKAEPEAKKAEHNGKKSEPEKAVVKKRTPKKK